MLVLAALLTDLAIKSTLLLALTAVLIRFMRTSSAASRHVVWTAALAAVLLLPLATAAFPTLPLRVLAARPIAERQEPAFGAATPATVAEVGHPQRVSLRTGARPEGEPWHPAGAVVALWVGGVVVLFARAAAGKVGLRHLARQVHRAPAARLLRSGALIAARSGIRRPVVLLVANRDVMPATWGIVRPKVLLPSSAFGWSDERLESVLVHEYVHIARFDALTADMTRFAVAVAWFNPLVWLAAREARLEAEMACDDVALQHVGRGSRYAAHLMALLETMAPLSSADALAVARRSRLRRRLDLILAAGTDRRGVSRGSFALAAVLIATSLPLAAARLAAQPVTVLQRTSVVTAAESSPAHDGARRVQIAESESTAVLTVAPPFARGPAARVIPTLHVDGGDVASDDAAGQAAGQTPSIPIVGRWVPRDAARQDSFFAVGLADLPGSGTLTIRQEGREIRLSRTDTDGQLAIRAAIGTVSGTDELLRIDGAEYTETRGQAEFHRTAAWDGEKLVIRTWWVASSNPEVRGQNEAVRIYSLEGSELRIECVGLNRVVMFLKRIG
jgi:beta-lactamase regulating signal transducer with metallopeptidase domain